MFLAIAATYLLGLFLMVVATSYLQGYKPDYLRDQLFPVDATTRRVPPQLFYFGPSSC